MAKTQFFIFLVVFLILANFASAATIYGSVYDLSLDKVNNARVEINTIPKQVMIAQNGTYSFNVPNGAYAIKAQQIQRKTIIASVQENITIKQSGNYVLDLILFPDVEEGIEEVNVDINDILKPNNNSLLAVAAIIIIFSMSILIYFTLKNRKQKKEGIGDKKEKIVEGNNQDKDIQNIIGLLKKEGGRTTQKEIRKEIPASEAKISLMIAELEHKGIVEKVKKGRGNIIILKR